MLLITSLFCLISWSYGDTSCRAENGRSIDWFIIMKYPVSGNFFYLSSDADNKEWQLPNYGLDSDQNMLAVTLQQAYNAKNNRSFAAFYNDEKPTTNAFEQMKVSGGHLKGVINFDNSMGYWLVHSTPGFPSRQTYGFPAEHRINAQSFLCVTLKTSNLKEIAKQLVMMYADVYFSNLPQDFSSDTELLSYLIKLINNVHTPGPVSEIIRLSTANGIALKHFGKTKKFSNDLYMDLIAPELKSTLFVESWLRDPVLKSNCSGIYHVYNVMKVKLNSLAYKNQVDHSKWAVSEDKSVHAVCIGDINRMKTQYGRGGGSLCMFTDAVWKIFMNSIADFEKCTNYHN